VNCLVSANRPTFSPSLWLASQPLLLASGSPSRAKILSEADIPFEVSIPQVNERALEAMIAIGPHRPRRIAATLARAKACDVSACHPNRLVLGGDQLLAVDGEIVHKAADLEEARATLRRLSGRTHQLQCAACLARDGEAVFEIATAASLTLHPLSDDFIDRYLAVTGEDILGSVGCYHVEGIGVQLFAQIVGDHWTVRGLPLLPLLAFLRESGYLCR